MTSVSVSDAERLLRQSAANNRTGLIGGPNVVGWSLTGALAALARSQRVERTGDVLVGHGEHGSSTWYLSLTPPPADPWG